MTREVPASRGRMTLAAGLGELCVHSLVDHMCATAEWERFDGRNEDWIRINPPTQVAQVLLARNGRWRSPVVAGIITTPTLCQDGSLLTEPGYDTAIRLYDVADPAMRLHPAVHRPTRAAAEAALSALEGLLAEFPFVRTQLGDGTELEVAKAVALSGCITPVVGGAMPVAPLHVYNAHAPGSGKSYLVDVASMIATGRPCPVITTASDEAELEEIRLPSAPQCRVWVPPAKLTEAEQEAWCDAKIAAEPNGGEGIMRTVDRSARPGSTPEHRNMSAN